MPAKCCIERWDRLMQEDPDMPVFTLLGKDELAIDTVRFWMMRAQARGVNAEKLAKVEEHLTAMEVYRANRPEKMQLPD